MNFDETAQTADPRFSGMERLVGRAELARLRRASVCVIGVGGVGGWAAEALARSGVGSLTLVDMDEVCVTNVNRQVHAVDATVGRSKIDAMAERLAAIAPELEIRREFRFFSEKSRDELLGAEPDVVVDCIDSIPHKCLLLFECRRRGLRAVTVGAAGGRFDPAAVRVDDLVRTFDDALLQRVRKKLRQKFDFPRHSRSPWGIPAVFSPEPARYPRSDGTVCAVREAGSTLRLDCASGYGTAAFVVGAFGFAAAAAAVRDITGLHSPPVTRRAPP